MKEVVLGLLGLGNIGGGVWDLIREFGDETAKRTGIRLRVKKALVLDKRIHGGKEVPDEVLTTDRDDILEDPEIQIVCEFLGGEQPAASWMKRALENGKSVVTANKMALSLHFDELRETARKTGAGLYYEASVGGAIPIINAIQSPLISNHIEQIMGIVNGTTNYILTRMAAEGAEYETVLKDAQRLGLAEPNPTADVEGYDAQYKLSILGSIGFHTRVNVDDVYREGITKINSEDISFGREMGYVLKLLAIGKDNGDTIEARVHPAFLPADHPLARVDGSLNAVYLYGHSFKDMMLEGRGAGDAPTASAIVGDIIQAAQNAVHPMPYMQETPKPVADDWHSRYFIRMKAKDEPGVLAEVTGKMAKDGISVSAMLQKDADPDGRATLIFITHSASEKAVRRAVASLNPEICQVENVIRVEELIINMWVLFDLDGTLTQSEEGIWKCARHALDKMGFPEPDAATLRKFIGPPLMWSFQNLAGMTEEQALQAQTIYRQRYNEVGLFENRVYPGIRYALRCLKKAGAHLGVVTGKPEKPTKRILEHFGLAPYFESVLCATDSKADKEQMIRDSLPEGSGEAWMVGDRKFDMEGGRRAGIHTLGVTYGYGSEEELLASGAEKLARTPREIAELLCPEIAGVRGAFLSMEGPDGSGKGTQLEMLLDTLDRYGFEVILTREPGGTPIGEKIRGILLDRENAGMTDETEALLYAAARAQLVREVIRPAVLEGKVILCDRFVDSSVAYQGGGRQMGVEKVLEINRPAVDGTMPDMTVYLDIDHRIAMARRCAASEPDRMEMEAESFHARVEDGYHQMIAMDPDRFAVISAEGSREAIAGEVARRVLEKLLETEK